MKRIDLRSDTVTQPTEEMREASLKAEVGDDVYGEDPSVNELEALAAEMLGKEAGLFVTSGTQGNQIAVLTHTKPGEEIILEAQSHIFYYEAGAVAALSGVQTRIIKGSYGLMPVAEIEQAVRREDLHMPGTSLICLENTHNRAGGTVLPLDYMKAVYEADRQGVPLHLDGARVFNAAVALGVDVKEITQYVDTVQFCLSKGLSAPVGSLLVGSREFIDRARKMRKRLGGGMRQAGIIAAPGIVALKTMVGRLSEDHQLAKDLAHGLAEIPGLAIDLDHVETNIVIADVKGLGTDAVGCIGLMAERGVLLSKFGTDLVRFTTHRQISESDIEYVLDQVRDLFVK